MSIESTLRSLSIASSCAGFLSDFVTLFEKWNRSINLSAASSRDEIIEHVVDSLQVVPHLGPAGHVLDVGSGGGFPVVVAAACLPSHTFVSLEPVHKKHAFLRTAARELRLVNLEARAERLEDHDGRGYDAAMSRATFDLVEWLALARPYVRAGGVVLAFEGVPRDDLPTSARRHSYAAGTKQRAIIVDSV
jgi:16S rRNA (guanine527-N7)-methyltransferase